MLDIILCKIRNRHSIENLIVTDDNRDREEARQRNVSELIDNVIDCVHCINVDKSSDIGSMKIEIWGAIYKTS